jgi:hypothetical protein
MSKFVIKVGNHRFNWTIFQYFNSWVFRCVKTDLIFYRLFQNVPSTFFELIGRSTDEAITYKFRSVEIKQTAFRIDGVFIPVADDVRSPLPTWS